MVLPPDYLTFRTPGRDYSTLTLMERAFVIRLRHEPDLQNGRIEGRIEHIDSGRVAHFQTVEELLDFLVASLTHVNVQVAAADEPHRPDT